MKSSVIMLSVGRWGTREIGFGSMIGSKITEGFYVVCSCIGDLSGLNVHVPGTNKVYFESKNFPIYGHPLLMPLKFRYIEYWKNSNSCANEVEQEQL